MLPHLSSDLVQLARVHVVQDPLRVLAIPLALHDDFRRIVLEIQNSVHSPLAKRINARQ